jgi:hypothetical protein
MFRKKVRSLRASPRLGKAATFASRRASETKVAEPGWRILKRGEDALLSE